MPYPNEHACRLNDPKKYDRFARKNCEQKADGKCIDVIYGVKGGKTEIQSLRYPKKIWTAAAARSHCSGREGTFEAAGESEEAMYEMSVKDAGGQMQTKLVSGGELADWFKAHTDEEGKVTEEVALFGAALFGKAKDGAADVVEWVMSDFTLDRDKERIDPSGWDLKQYKKNPVVLWSHDVMRPAIGRVVSPRVSNGALKGKVEFAPKEIDEFAWQVGQKVKAGFLSAGSVGFRPIKVEMVDPEQEPKEEARAIIRKAELFEFSVCNVPANPSARPVEQTEPGKVEEVSGEKAQGELEELSAADIVSVDDTDSSTTTDNVTYINATGEMGSVVTSGFLQLPVLASKDDIEAAVSEILVGVRGALEPLIQSIEEIKAGLGDGVVDKEELCEIIKGEIAKGEAKKSYLHDLFKDRGSRRETSVTRETSGLDGLFGSRTDARGVESDG